MNKRYLIVIFYSLIVLFAAIVLIHRVRLQSMYLERDIRNNAFVIQRMLEYYYNQNDRSCYPRNVLELMQNVPPQYDDRMIDPYSHQLYRISDHGEMNRSYFSPGNFLYVPTDYGADKFPRGYRLYMLGRTSDPFYNSTKATEWKKEYEELTGRPGPDNIVFVYTELHGGLAER